MIEICVYITGDATRKPRGKARICIYIVYIPYNTLDLWSIRSSWTRLGLSGEVLYVYRVGLNYNGMNQRLFFFFLQKTKRLNY